MLPASYRDDAGEIDVMEVLGRAPAVQEMHYHAQHRHFGESWTSPQDLSKDFHTYAVDWEPRSITWYVDGVERFHFSNASRVVKEAMYLILNLAVGGTWAGDPDASTPFPAAMQVDWIRVWQAPQ
jgi:beta-glucanase (GH16 family)